MTKKEYIKAIKDFIGDKGFIPFEHNYKSSISFTHPKDNELYQMWGLSDTQVFGIRKLTSTLSTTSRVSFSKLKVNEVAEVYNEMIKYYNFVINLNK